MWKNHRYESSLHSIVFLWGDQGKYQKMNFLFKKKKQHNLLISWFSELCSLMLLLYYNYFSNYLKAMTFSFA